MFLRTGYGEIIIIHA